MCHLLEEPDCLEVRQRHRIWNIFVSFFHFHFFCLSKFLFVFSQGTYSVLEAKQIHPSVSCSKAIFYFYYIHIFNILELHHLMIFSTLTCCRSLLTGRDVKGNTPFHIAARMNGSLGNFLKDFVNLYSDKVFRSLAFEFISVNNSKSTLLDLLCIL